MQFGPGKAFISATQSRQFEVECSGKAKAACWVEFWIPVAQLLQHGQSTRPVGSQCLRHLALRSNAEPDELSRISHKLNSNHDISVAQQNSSCRAAKIVVPERIVQDSQLGEATESSGGEDPGYNLPCSKVFPLPGSHLRLRISKAVNPAPLP
eukprot:scaffold64_cov338-Pavlova_lutheri.AAC.86